MNYASRRSVLVPLAILAASLCTPAAAQSAKPVPGQLKTQWRDFMQPFVGDWCGQCHSGEEPESSLHLVKLFEKFPASDSVDMLRDMRDVLKSEEMPPDDEPAPEPEDRDKALAWIDKTIAHYSRGEQPGRVTMRRLSRVEYRNTVRDLFGIHGDVTQGFPAEDLGYGFDNIGGTLSTSVLHIEKYAATAGRIAEIALGKKSGRKPRALTLQAEEQEMHGTVRARGSHAVFISRGHIDVRLPLPRAGRYRLLIRAYGQQAGNEAPKMELTHRGKLWKTFDVEATRAKPRDYEYEFEIDNPRATIRLSYTNDYYNPKAKDRSRRDRNLFVDAITVSGPLDAGQANQATQWIFDVDPGKGSTIERARPILRRIMERAWRRPVQDPEVERIAALTQRAVAEGDAFWRGIELGIQAVLVSPHFLFRIEPGGIASEESKTQAPALDGYAMATRLSYFLWSSTPDTKLLTRAAAGELTTPEQLVAATKRMLRDPKAKALATNFAGQWLELRSLDRVPSREKANRKKASKRKATGLTRSLREAMRRESELLFQTVLDDGLPAKSLLDAPFTFLNAPLAKHYGIAGIRGEAMQRTDKIPARRRGILGHASILTITSDPTRTSPVKRGKWILDNLLDDPPPPPKPGTDSFQGKSDLSSPANMRAQLAAHRAEQACAVCHNRMDPLGLAMENFDAQGRWRDKHEGLVIDASGKLPNGTALDGPATLRKELMRGTAFVRCLTKKLFLFGVGRPVRGVDESRIDKLVQKLGAQASIADILVGLVQLDAFRRREIAK